MKPILVKSSLFNDENIVVETMRQCMLKMIDNNILDKRSAIKKKDTIDVSSWATKSLGTDYVSMPAMQLVPEEIQAIHTNWCLSIPPVLDGVLRANRDRYLVFEVTNIDMENTSYDVTIFDYAFEQGIWSFNTVIIATINLANQNLKFNYNELSNYDYIKALFIDHTTEPKIYIDGKLYDNVQKHLLPFLKECIDDDKANNTPFGENDLNHFFASMVKINIELMNGKRPKAVRNKNTDTKVKTITDKVPEKNPKPQIVRTLSSGITIKSASVPKAPTVEVVRHYKVASWNVRGHMRHYKDGKVVYIPPRVAKRKGFENADVAKRQTIIISGSKASKIISTKKGE